MTVAIKIPKPVSETVSAADALNNAKQIIEYLNNPNSDKTNLDGLDAAIASLSLSAYTATQIATVANATVSGAATGAMATGIAFQLNGASAAASLSATYAYLKQGNIEKAASASLGVVTGISGMVQTGASTLPGVNPVEGAAGAVNTAATVGSLTISNSKLLKTVTETVSDALGEIYDEKLKDFRDWFLPKAFELGEKLDGALDSEAWEKAFSDFGDWLREKFSDIGDWFDQAQKDFGEWFIPFAKDLGDLLSLPWDGKYHIYDPLVLDLDGDGIETVAAKQFSGALFDHENNGVRIATGWVKSDDGILVYDKNSDGIINNGNELFGDNTVLAGGSKASHGYSK